jgi:hypothetical protein
VANKNQNQVKANNLKSLYNQTVTDHLTGSADEETLPDYLSWDVSNTLYFTDLSPALKALDQRL